MAEAVVRKRTVGREASALFHGRRRLRALLSGEAEDWL